MQMITFTIPMSTYKIQMSNYTIQMRNYIIQMDNKHTESIAKSNTGPPPAPINSNLVPLF